MMGKVKVQHLFCWNVFRLDALCVFQAVHWLHHRVLHIHFVLLLVSVCAALRLHTGLGSNVALVKLFAVWAVFCTVVHILVLKARLFYWIVPLGQLQQQLLYIRGNPGVHLKLGLCVSAYQWLHVSSPGAHYHKNQV